MANRRTKLRQVGGVSSAILPEDTGASTSETMAVPGGVAGCKITDIVVASWAGTRVAGVCLQGRVLSTGSVVVDAVNYTTSLASTAGVAINVVVLRAGA
jgi:hypothetical protein